MAGSLRHAVCQMLMRFDYQSPMARMFSMCLGVALTVRLFVVCPQGRPVPVGDPSNWVRT